MTTSSQLLFVYGTLRRKDDSSLHPYLQNRADFLGLAEVPGQLYEVSGYPAAVYQPQQASLICGELYSLHDPQHCLRLLDDYEECSSEFPPPREYCRSLSPVRLAGRTDAYPAWVYWYNWPIAGLTPITSGDYAAFIRQSAPRR